MRFFLFNPQNSIWFHYKIYRAYRDGLAVKNICYSYRVQFPGPILGSSQLLYL